MADTSAVQLRRFSLGLATPLGTANGEIRRREGFLVSIASDVDGTGGDTSLTGIGESTPLPGWTESLSACEAALREFQSDLDGDPVEARRADALDPELPPAARHGLSLALDGVRARAADRSLGAHLAARHDVREPAESVPVNATIGDGDPGATARAATEAVDAGFECLKIKVGVRTLDADIARLRTVRRAVGSEVALRADANGAWDRATAERAVARLAPLDLAYVEQPLSADEIEGAAALRELADGTPPIALDESLAVCGLDEVLAADAADVVVLKPMALGGPDRALAAALQAQSAGVEPVVTTTIDAVVARTAAVHVAAAVPDIRPCGLATGSLLDEDLAADPCQIEAGRAPVPVGPGLAGDAFDGLRN
ncbi:mandelate racemase/muconate lactonizing enzyme family protein [Halorubrum sp. DTA46]|uniref:mandelate racemase/muconate lactonizing enzyme family protein n=1 Tax=Halorubrum sp. DTA46 TaxID=3402162 RepID=UPI003AABDF59